MAFGTIKELVKLAGELRMPAGALDDELNDAIQDQARLDLADIQRESLAMQLQFLVDRHYGLERLEELIREAAKEDSKE